MLRRVPLVRTDVLGERSASIIRMTRIDELGATLGETSKQPMHAAKICNVPPKLRFLQEPHGVTFQKTTFFIVTAVKTSNPT
jgi:hypothetical protein